MPTPLVTSALYQSYPKHMDDDLSKLLAAWPLVPGKLNCRIITGLDGEPKLQVRVEMGILQLNLEGRPDGLAPHGFPSALEYYEHLIDGGREREDPTGSRGPQGREPVGADEPGAESEKSALTSEECREIREEAELFYRRYVALLTLENYELVVRDTTRNLRAIDFIRDYAERDEDRQGLDELRPYVLMTRTRAVASMALRDNEPKAALLALDEGLDALKRAYVESGNPQAFEKSSEAQMLRSMREGLVPRLPVSQRSELRERLSRAIADENYELAAILRDELKQLQD